MSKGFSCICLAALLAACGSLPSAEAGAASNVVTRGDLAYVSLGAAGLGVMEVGARRMIRILPPAAGSGSVDDLAVTDGLLFALDAAPPGHLSVYALADGRDPAPVAGPVEVPVGPYAGVSAASGRVVVSGGTSALTVRGYDAGGRLGAAVGNIDLGSGQPDILLAPDGARAFVSTHFQLSDFGVSLLSLGPPPERPRRRGALSIEGAGFSPGGAAPANFPIEAALSGDRLLVAFGGGLSVVDVQDLDRPRLVATADLPVRGVAVDVLDGVAAVVGSDPSPLIVLLDVRAPDAPVLERSLPLPGPGLVTGVALTPTHVVVAAHQRGLVILDR